MLENENMIDLLRSLKEMSSEQLSRLIQEETAKECPNDELVLMALDILEEREKERPIKLGHKGKAAWKNYQSKIRSRNRKTVLIWKPLMQVASVVLVITLLFALLPTQANAETWWERLARWTNDFFSFLSTDESELPEENYVFRTNNEGLQQLYDSVVKLGISDPVVPMWLPDEYNLSELKVESTPKKEYVVTSFSNGDSELVIKICIIKDNNPNKYHKDRSDVDEYECYGITHNIIQNEEITITTWTKDNIECSIFIDCQEDILFRIIDSIYRWRNVE